MDSDDSSQKVLLRPEEAASRLSIGRTQLFTLLKQGRLDSIKVGRLRRIPVASLLKFIEHEGSAQ